MERRVVANVPASLHGRVMCQASQSPSPCCGPRPHYLQGLAQGMQSDAWAAEPFEKDASLGPGAHRFSLASEI